MITVRWAEAHVRFPQVEFRRLFQSIKRPVPPAAEMVTAYTDGTVTLRSNRRRDGYHEAANMSGMQGVRVGDFVIHGLDILRGSVGISNSEGALSSVCIVCKPIGDVDPRYFAWVIRAQAATGFPRALARGIREGGADFRRWATLAELPVPLPPLVQQRAIADYLDTETGRIDALISKKRRMIELLEERRSHYVSEAVTVGLDTRPKLGDTGNHYAPRIPSSWRLMRLRHAVRQIIDTPHKTAPVVDGEKYLVVRTSNVKKGRLVFDDARYTDRASWLEWNRRGKPRPGDVMFTREAPAGEACVVPAAIPLCIGQRMVLFRVNRSVTCGEWVVHSIYSRPAQRFIEDLSRSTTVAHLNMGDIPDIPIVVPDLSEQKEILTHIRAAVRRQELTVSKLQKQVDLLAERRQSVITAAVTGELVVSGSVE